MCGVWVKVWLGSPEQAVELQLSRRALRLVDDHTQMKSHEHSDVVDNSAGRGFEGWGVPGFVFRSPQIFLCRFPPANADFRQILRPENARQMRKFSHISAARNMTAL